jgi:hypothetical protein
MKQIVIMPGGFHPFHAGHAALYQSALKAFPNADVYVAATNDTKTRPFPFAIKEKLAKLAGVADQHFVQVKSPFKAEEITSHYNPNEDVLIFVRSEKDKTEQPKPGGTKKDGSPAYFQPWTGKNLQPFSKHAYIAYLPTVEFGPGIKSATEIRNAWPNLDDRRKTAMVMSLYPVTQKNPKLVANVVKMLDIGMGGQEGVAEGSNGSDIKLSHTQSTPDTLYIHASIEGSDAGGASFKRKDGVWTGDMVYVQPYCRRQGVATKMYDYAEDLVGKIIPSNNLKPKGKKFWASRDTQGVAEGLEYADKLSGLVDLPVFNSSTNPNPSGVAKVVNTGDRIMVVMNVRGVNVPYYISTGQGGKASVPTGKWYPVFGVHSSGWLNKGGEDSINKFYGSKMLALNAGRLNNALGDLSSVEAQIPFMKKTGIEIINKDLQPMGHSEVSANPDEFKKRVNAFLAKLGSEPFYKVNATQTQGVAEGAPIVVAQAPIDVRNPKKAPQPYRNQGDIVPPTQPPSTEKRGVKGRPGQRPMPTYESANLSVEQLAHISDKALDDAYHYGRSTPGANFGWMANLQSAKAAKKLIDAGETDIEVISDAIHKGWNVTAAADYKGQLQLDTPTPEDKKLKRAKLAMQSYSQLPEEEKEKDRVVARAMLAALGKTNVSESADYLEEK